MPGVERPKYTKTSAVSTCFTFLSGGTKCRLIVFFRPGSDRRIILGALVFFNEGSKLAFFQNGMTVAEIMVRFMDI